MEGSVEDGIAGLERFHKTIKGECLRKKTPLTLDDARRLVAEYVEHYNAIRLHSSIGYIAPVEKLNGREKKIFTERDRKLEAARQQRKIKRQQQYEIQLIPGAHNINSTEKTLA